MDQTDEGAEAGARMRRVGSVLESFFDMFTVPVAGRSMRPRALRRFGTRDGPRLCVFAGAAFCARARTATAPPYSPAAFLSKPLPSRYLRTTRAASRGAQAEVSMASSGFSGGR